MCGDLNGVCSNNTFGSAALLRDGLLPVSQEEHLSYGIGSPVSARRLFDFFDGGLC